MVLGVSSVVPIYRGTTSLMRLDDRVGSVLVDRSHELIRDDDGSPSETWRVVRDLAVVNERVVGMHLGRNSGQHFALFAGVRTARFKVAVTIDDDLQSPPEEIPKLLQAMGVVPRVLVSEARTCQFWSGTYGWMFSAVDRHRKC